MITTMKTRVTLDQELMDLVRLRSMTRIKKLLWDYFQKQTFSKLSNRELQEFLNIVKLEIEKGLI